MRQDTSNEAVEYFLGIDGLRAVAVLSVLLYHFEGYWLPGGFIGVDVFFVISGYVISNSLAKHHSTDLSGFLLDFYKRRLLRIVPALLACLLTTVIVSSLFIPESWLSAKNDATGKYAFFGLSNFALLSDLDGYFSQRVAFNPYVHTWSLAVEEQFYLVFPLMLFFVLGTAGTPARSRLVAQGLFIGVALVSLIYSGYETFENQQKAFYLLPSRFWEMATGAILYGLHSRGHYVARTGLSPLVVEVSGVSLLGLAFALAHEASFPFPWAIAPVLGTAMLIDSLLTPGRHASVVHTVLQARPVTYVGKISYSIYLWHWPVIILFRWTVGLIDVVQIVVALVIIVALSTASYHLLETPVRRNAALQEMASKKLVSGCLCVVLATFLAGNEISSRPWRFNQSVTYRNNDWKAYYVGSDSRTVALTGLDLSPRKIFVVGDSHAGAYSAMLGAVSAHLGVIVHKRALPGCPIASLIEPYPDTDTCRNFVEDTMRFIKEEAAEKDLVFFASLRAYRLSSQAGYFSETEIADARDSAVAQMGRRNALTQAGAIVDRMNALGLHVLIDAPKPVFRAPPFRCADWFNQMNPVCTPGFTISRSFLQKHNLPILKALATLKESHPFVEIWDPFPLLCSQDVCSAYEGKRPLFFDGDHLSGYGNLVLVPSFESTILKLLASPH